MECTFVIKINKKILRTTKIGYFTFFKALGYISIPKKLKTQNF